MDIFLKFKTHKTNPKLGVCIVPLIPFGCTPAITEDLNLLFGDYAEPLLTFLGFNDRPALVKTVSPPASTSLSCLRG